MGSGGRGGIEPLPLTPGACLIGGSVTDPYTPFHHFVPDHHPLEADRTPNTNSGICNSCGNDDNLFAWLRSQLTPLDETRPANPHPLPISNFSPRTSDTTQVGPACTVE